MPYIHRQYRISNERRMEIGRVKQAENYRQFKETEEALVGLLSLQKDPIVQKWRLDDGYVVGDFDKKRKLLSLERELHSGEKIERESHRLVDMNPNVAHNNFGKYWVAGISALNSMDHERILPIDYLSRGTELGLRPELPLEYSSSEKVQRESHRLVDINPTSYSHENE